MAMTQQSMNLCELDNIRLSGEALSPVEVERLRFLLPKQSQGWSQKSGQPLSQLEVILEAIDYIKTLQGKLDLHASSQSR